MTNEDRCPECGAPFQVNGSTLRICARSCTWKRATPDDDWYLASAPFEQWHPPVPAPFEADRPPILAPAAASPIRRMSQVDREEVHWLWRPYIPLGKLTLLEGDPGVGKSWLSLAIATAVSRGTGPPGMELQAPGTTLLLTAEDGLGDTVGPRLDLLGADDARVFALPPDQPVTLVDLEMLVLQVRPLLVIIDPLPAFLGRDIDMHRSNETRPILASVAAMAERHHCAVLIVRHITKGAAGRAIYRGVGSIDFTAAARSVLLAGADPEEPQKCALVHIKSNLAAKGEALGYQLDETGFAWVGVSDLTAARILDGAESGEAPSKLEEAIDFLQQALAEGGQPAERVKADAKALEISDRTLRRARKELNVRPVAVGHQRTGGVLRWDWVLAKDEGGHFIVSPIGQVPPLLPDDEYYRQLAAQEER